MADNESDYRCPLCGKEMNEEDNFCGDCREIADNSYPNELLANSALEEVIEEAEIITEAPVNTVEESIDTPVAAPPKSNKKLIIFVLVGALLLVLIGGVGSYIRIQTKNTEEAHDAYWNRCISENTPLAYSKYLVQYPEGKYSELAQNKIIELRESERKEWDKLRKKSNVEALFSFLKDHPDTPYSKEIRHVIDSLSWVATAEANTKEAYLAYIENSDLGRYSGEYIDLAQQRHDYLDQLKTIEGEELEEIAKKLNDFFKALSSVDSKDIQKVTAPVLNKFYKVRNQESTQIADSIKNSFKKDKVRKISYMPQTKAMEVIQDNKGIYFITLPMNTETTFTDRKKKKEEDRYILSIILNKEKLIQSVEIKLKYYGTSSAG
ncbi:MAG: hypothetical protein ACK5KT_15390 [Dysgonomonas sp.]